MIKNLVLSILLTVGISAGFARDNRPADWQNIYFIELGTKWEVEVKSNVDSDEPAKHVEQWLDGTETINDIQYLKLWISIDDNEAYLASYIRLEKPFVYALDPNDIERGERLIYCLSIKSSPLTLAAMSWDGHLSAEDYSCTIDYGEDISSCGWDWYGFKVTVNAPDNETYSGSSLCTATWYDGFGGAQGFTNQLYALDHDYTTILKRVTTTCNGVIYEDKSNESTPNAIEGIKNESFSKSIKYHIDGTLFKEGEKGLYIMNGKKYIAR